MEKYSKHFSVEEILEILKDHIKEDNIRIHCVTSHSGMNWDGILVSVYEKNRYCSIFTWFRKRLQRKKPKQIMRGVRYSVRTESRFYSMDVS